MPSEPIPQTEREVWAEAMLQSEQFVQVCEAFDARPPETLAERRQYGVALLRGPRPEDAEPVLLAAYEDGDPEAGVEYGNMLRFNGHFSKAVEVFEALFPRLHGELQYRALRWWGVADFQAGRVEQGLTRVKRARFWYMEYDEGLGGRVTQSLAQMYVMLAQPDRARSLYRESLRLIPEGLHQSVRLASLQGLANLHIEDFQLDEAQEQMDEVFALLDALDSVPMRTRAIALAVQAEIYRQQVQDDAFAAVMETRVSMLPLITEFETRVGILEAAADLYSRQGQFAASLAFLEQHAPENVASARLELLRGIIFWRSGDPQGALDVFSRLEGGRYLTEAKARGLEAVDLSIEERAALSLYLAASLLNLGDLEQATAVLGAQLRDLSDSDELLRQRFVLSELSDLVEYAMLDPDLAPMMEVVLRRLAQVTRVVPEVAETPAHVQAYTLGRRELIRNGRFIDLEHSMTLPLLAYLASHPNRTRQQVHAALYSDLSGAEADAVFRDVFREVRQKLGPQVLRNVGTPTDPGYAIAPDVHFELDVTEFKVLLLKRQLNDALRLYFGPFLDGLPGASWVGQQRTDLELALAGELLKAVDQAEQRGETELALRWCCAYQAVLPGADSIQPLRRRLTDLLLREDPPQAARETPQQAHLN